MILQINVIRKNDNMTVEAFRDYMLNIHAPKAAALPELAGYHQNHILVAQKFVMASTNQVVDCFEFLFFNSDEDLNKCWASEAYREVCADESNYADDVQVLVTDRHTVTPVHYEKKLVKRMSIITRKPGVDFDKFKYEWYVNHAGFVQQMPGVEGYHQDLITERYSPRGRYANRSKVYIDGIVELYFETQDKLNESFSSDNGIRSNWHTRTIIQEVTPFLVEEHIIK